MSGVRNTIFKSIFSAMYRTGVAQLCAPFISKRGAIFMLHHVDPEPPADFEPNRILKVTPQFLDGVIKCVQSAGYDIISLDEVPERLANPDAYKRPFACFTLDDGYRDNWKHAYPVFKKHNVPFTVYVPSAFPSGKADLWWLTLEDVLKCQDQISLQMDDQRVDFSLRTTAEKNTAFDEIYWWLRAKSEDDTRALVRQMAQDVGYDANARARELLLTWSELRNFSADPLVTIGAHTENHYALAKLSSERAHKEMAKSIAGLEEKLGRPVQHFSYPYGDEGSAGPREFAFAQQLGMKTAVTTRKGLVNDKHVDSLTSLPRFSLNGDFQDLKFVEVLLTGLPFAIWRILRRIRKMKSRDLLVQSARQQVGAPS